MKNDTTILGPNAVARTCISCPWCNAKLTLRQVLGGAAVICPECDFVTALAPRFVVDTFLLEELESWIESVWGVSKQKRQ